MSYILPFLSHPSLPPPCVLHGDLFLENCIVEVGEVEGEQRLLGLIDFEEMALGPHLLDVAMTLVGTCYDDADRIQLDLAAAFLSAYHAVRGFTELDCQLLVPFLHYALLAIGFWRFRQFNVRLPGSEREDAYRSMQTRMQQLMQGTLAHDVTQLIRSLQRSVVQ